MEILFRGAGFSKYAPGEFWGTVSVETVSRKTLGSGLGWGKLRTEDSPVYNWGRGGRTQSWESGICVSVTSKALFILILGKNT